MKWLVFALFITLVSCHQIDVPYEPECHSSIRFAIEPRYHCVWQEI